ncbi:uncharacterized protein BBA_10145 [Beauveria bassiana ARSEF 2860]|uniref:Uncharacterized protein n=1 Tax=Beauveria bassiana (strain ARSEF 2860) TaxID=655819 RepID=J4UEY2_BEAB2|nr:uncharacterized protein BBA_10145 [Beauveria bassiana ARSEF 2860]EJP60902.1 hypothetical protein BBA_10145 [Beauveria bassiana ARSEF 2860]
MSQSDNWPSDADDCQSHLTSDDEVSQNVSTAPRSRLRPAGKAPVTLLYDCQTSDEDELTIPYNVEWKLFWRRLLQPKLETAMEKKPCRVDDTEIVMSTTHRSTGPFRKRFANLDIEWLVIEKQLQDWNELPNTGKKRNLITINITFESTYIESNKVTRGRATVNQLEELQARIGDGAVLSRGVCVKKAFALMRCPGPPCKKGSDHCWQSDGQHYPLHPHHVKMLADHLQAGKPLDGHDDVPETFRRLVLDDERDRQSREENERAKRKRRRPGSENLTINPPNPAQLAHDGRTIIPAMVFPTTPLMGFAQRSEDNIRAHTTWLKHGASDEQKGHYEFMQQLALRNGYDLDYMHSNKERVCVFSMDEGVPEGFAWRYVSGVPWFKKEREKAAGN